MDRSVRAPLVIYSSDRSGCSLIALLAAMTSALFLQVWGWIRSGWWVSLLLALLALAMLFRRRAILIDSENRQVTLIERWFVPVTRRRTVAIDRLTVRLQLPAAGSEPGFPSVWLDPAEGSSFRLDVNSAEDARESAQRLATDLGKTLLVRES